MPSPPATPPSTVPDDLRVWLLLGHKAGDTAQVTALAEALGWPYTAKRLRYRRTELLTNRLLPPNLAGIDPANSSPLQPPWPHLVITAGRRNEPVARWVRERSGGSTRLVHLGRPWAHPRHFDLVVTTPQYRVPAAPNVLENDLPLHLVTPARLEDAAAEWKDRLAGLPRPYLALLVGGDSGPVVFDRRAGLCLGGEASSMVLADGGSLLITTSARTPAAVVDALRRSAVAPTYFYRWSPNDPDNPYFGFLGLADRLIVTGESVSMLTEACATGKPVFIFDPSRHPLPLHCDGPHRAPTDPRCRHWLLQARSFRWKPLTHRLAQVIGPRRMRRDVGTMQRHLIGAGRAAWLGEPAPQAGSAALANDLERAVSRVRSLLEE